MIFRKKKMESKTQLFYITETRYISPARITYRAWSYANCWKGAERQTRTEAEEDGKRHEALLREFFSK